MLRENENNIHRCLYLYQFLSNIWSEIWKVNNFNVFCLLSAFSAKKIFKKESFWKNHLKNHLPSTIELLDEGVIQTESACVKWYNLALNSGYQQSFLAIRLTGLTSQDCCEKGDTNIVQQPFCRNGNGESRSVVIYRKIVLYL